MIRKRKLQSNVDRFAVPVSAAIVGWVVADAWLLPELPRVFTESEPMRFLGDAACAALGYGTARRLL